MKKLSKLVFSSFALLALISCGMTSNTSSEADNSDSIPDSSETSSSSSQESTSQDAPSSSSSSSSSASSSSSRSSSSSSQSSSSSSSSSASSAPSSSSSSNIEVTYHVRFVNYDDTLLYETDVLAGHEAVYVGDTPTKPEDNDFTFEFDGWDKDLTSITSDLTAKATFKQKDKINYGPVIWF